MTETGSLPRVLINTVNAAEISGRGAVWKLDPHERDLDANLIALPPGDGIATHEGPDLDVLVHVVAGSGHLDTGGDAIELVPGAVLWLPRRSRRGFMAGPHGLRYLTVHQRRQPSLLNPTFDREDRSAG